MRYIIILAFFTLSLSGVGQNKLDKVYFSVGYGFNIAKTKFWTLSQPSLTRLYIDEKLDNFFGVPIRLGFEGRLINVDFTHHNLFLSRTFATSPYSSTQFNLDVSIIELIKKDLFFDLNIGGNYSLLSLSKPSKGINSFLGGSISFGVKKFRLRYTLGTMLDSDSIFIFYNKKSAASKYWTLNLMYDIYPFRKREKKKE